MAYHVLCHSILRHSSQPVAFTPINKRNIPEFDRGMEDGSTEFSFSRFLTPWLCDFKGWGIFMDCDMLVRDDISKVFDYVDLSHDVFCVHHDYVPRTETKFLGNTQHVYPRKNWSSFMVFNNERCTALQPEIVNTASGAYLHQFKWTNYPGLLPIEWNHLVGEYHENPNAKAVHFTLGTPCFKGYEEQEFANEWYAEKALMESHD